MRAVFIALCLLAWMPHGHAQFNGCAPGFCNGFPGGITVSQGLVAYYPFDGNFNDLSGNGNNGSGAGTPTFVTGQIAQAVNLNGSQSVNVGVISFTALKTTPFSGSCWVKTSMSGAQASIMGNWLAGSTPGWYFFMNASGFIGLVLDNAADSASRTRTATTLAINNGAFHLASFSYDGSNTAAGIVLYVDAALPTISTIRDTDPGTLINNGFRIGVRADGNFFLTGAEDDCRLYNRNVSISEWQQIYAAGQAGRAANDDGHRFANDNLREPPGRLIVVARGD